MMTDTRRLLRDWGMNTSLLDSEWTVLSGGESQRMLVAISLASLVEDSVVLLDESTSALDFVTKLKVEKMCGRILQPTWCGGHLDFPRSWAKGPHESKIKKISTIVFLENLNTALICLV